MSGIHFPSSSTPATSSNHPHPHSSHPITTTTNTNTNTIHHPRQPGPHSDSYFGGHSSNHSHSSSHHSHHSHPYSHSTLPKTPSSSTSNKHQRTTSNTSFTPSMNNQRSSLDMNNNNPSASNTDDSLTATNTNSIQRNHPGSINIDNDYPHPDFDGPNDHQLDSHGNHHQHQQHFPAGPPSPSSLTDTILGLHSTLYGGKRSPEEVEEMVARYYESDAIFVNPLLSAHGRAQIANQFCMAFALPGMDVTSELRDVICSDFEFDGTRAGIIDQTITVTFLPTLFGSSSSSSQPSGGGGYAAEFGGNGPHGGGAHGYDASEFGPPFADGSSTPGYALQSGIPLHGLGPTTPHPFANYSTQNSAHPYNSHSNSQTPAASGFQRHGGWHGGGRMSQGQSPVTPFSVSGMWNSTSRPHTPGWTTGSGSIIKPLSSSGNGNGSGLPPNAITNTPSQLITAEESGGGAATSEVLARPSMPEEVLKPHWSAGGGLGRRTIHGLLWSIFHPREVLKELCSIKLHLMSRLEFNDAGLIVRHEDMWSLREAIEGIVPFASTVYAIERRVAGLLVHWTIGKGFKLSAALLRKALPGPNASAAEKSAYAIAQHEHEQTLRASNNGQFALESGNQVHEQYHSKQQERAGEAARALLNHRPPIPNVPGWYEGYQTISRSRAPSPTRYRWSTASSNAGTSTGGRRSRTHSIGCPPYSRTVSSDNLVGYGQASASMSNLPLSNNLAGSQISGADTLPPDAGAKYRRKINTDKDQQSITSRSSSEFDAGLHLNFGGGGEERGRTLGPAQDRD